MLLVAAARKFFSTPRSTLFLPAFMAKIFISSQNAFIYLDFIRDLLPDDAIERS